MKLINVYIVGKAAVMNTVLASTTVLNNGSEVQSSSCIAARDPPVPEYQSIDPESTWTLERLYYSENSEFGHNRATIVSRDTDTLITSNEET